MPDFVSRLFWDYDQITLDFLKHKDFIIERVLEKGNFDGVKWLLGTFDKLDILNTVNSSSNISYSTRNLWSQMLS